MDWTGLLQWSIDQTKGEFNKNIQPMDEDTKKWLSEALDNQFVDEYKRMKELLLDIAKPEADDEDQRLLWLEELNEILDALDRANDFCKLGGLALLINYQRTTKFASIRQECLKIIASSNQNNAEVQLWTGANGGFEILKQLPQSSLKEKELIFSLFSAVVRGECLENKRRFIDLGGLQVLLDNLDSAKCQEKAINIIRDLLYYDETLNRTFHDLSRFSNTGGQSLNKQQGYNLNQDINEELAAQNEQPENAKYKGIVKKTLLDLNFYDYCGKFLNSNEYKFSETRIAYLSSAQQLIKLQKSEKVLEQIRAHKAILSSAQEQDEAEVQLCDQLLQ